MFNLTNQKISRIIFFVSLVLLVYMPLHVFIVQSASLVTGGLEVWKAAKDVLLVALVPVVLYMSYRRELFNNKTFRWLMILGGAYTLLHGLFVLFDQNDDTYSAIVGSVYNTRLLGYLLLGYLVGTAKNAEKYLKYLLTAVVLIATVVAVFGIAQYFLPADLLENVGYTLERGVKPLFFIDDKPDLPRVMSTLKDPNSFGAYLIMPILMTATALFRKSANKQLFVRPFRMGILSVMLGLMFTALILTFSRGALVGLFLSAAAMIYILIGDKAGSVAKKFRKWWLIAMALVAIGGVGVYAVRDSYIFENLVFHGDESTTEADPNEKRISFTQDSVDKVVEEPFGYGPGSAGLVSIKNPKGGFLTENYYLQIAYEVGWLGITIFIAILAMIFRTLHKISNNRSQTSLLAVVLLASLIAYLFYSLLIHLWSNEAVAFQWWLLAGLTIGVSIQKHKNLSRN